MKRPTAGAYAGGVTFVTDWAGERFATFTNDVAATARLPATPRIGCTLVYDVTGAGGLTIDGMGNNIKPAGGDPAATLTLGVLTLFSGRLAWNGTNWVNIR